MRILLNLLLISTFPLYGAIVPEKKLKLARCCSLGLRTRLRVAGELTLHITNLGCGAAGIYWGTTTLIDQVNDPDIEKIIVSLMGGLISGTGSVISGGYGIYQMLERTKLLSRSIQTIKRKKSNEEIDQ